MIKKALHKVKNYLQPKAVVLMYHRIAQLPTDVWEIAVSPRNFELQLQVLHNKFRVIPLDELVHLLKKGALKRNYIAISFDDGCKDNFYVAKPLLEKYNIPATFFIPSGFIGGQKAFWWDVLENIFLTTMHLPNSISININQTPHHFQLANESVLTDVMIEKHRSWQPYVEPPPTQRAYCYFTIWQKLKELPHAQIDEVIFQIDSWANEIQPNTSNGNCMAIDKALKLDAHPLFNIGSHTVHHPALAFQNLHTQKEELEKDKVYWELVLKRNVNILAYPYGNYNEDTQQIAANLNFAAAFTTEEKCIKAKSNLFALPRVQVKNWDPYTFKQSINRLMK